MTLTVVLAVIVVIAGVIVLRSVRHVPRETAEVVERLGRYHRTLDREGVALIVPFIERVRARVDLREQVTTFPPQPITLADGQVADIDWVLSFEVMDAKAAVYEVSDYLMALEQLGATALRAFGAKMDLAQLRAAPDEINGRMRDVLGKAAKSWGIRVRRVRLRNVVPKD